MDWALLAIYVLLMALLITGVRVYGRGKWNEEWLSLEQTKLLQGFLAVLIMFHHMAQKTCAPWHAQRFIVHGLDVFVPIGYLFVGVFLFFSGFGLYRSVHTKPDYLKGFPRRRILPIVAAFYLSDWLYLAVRALMGERMDWKQLLWYATGAQLANTNAWYVIALPIFYLFFYAAFRLCKKDGWAMTVTAALILGYITLGTFIDHNDWWMRGEWWYNTAHLFVLGMVFARVEQPIRRAVKKHWWLWTTLAIAGAFIFFYLSEHTVNTLSYYGETWHAPDKVLRRWGCLATQMLSSTFFSAALLLLGMKVRLGNRVLTWLGSVTMELYLIHGIFVELFGYDFMEARASLVYIRSVPLYVLAVIACAIPATVLFRLALKPVKCVIAGKRLFQAQRPAARGKSTARRRKAAARVKPLPLLCLGIVAAAVIFLAVTKVILPENRYRKAEQLRADGQYEAAAAAFADLGAYRDASTQITETAYQQARRLLDKGDQGRAAAMLLFLGGYRDVDELIGSDATLSAAVEAASARNEQFSVGSYVTFGAYPQTEAGTDLTPIEWQVLARDQHRALLISRYALDCQPFNGSYINAPWAACSLRRWLNKAFFSKAFTPREQTGILETAVDNSRSQGCFDAVGLVTRDKVFLLSYAEAWTYLQGDKARRCEPTAYALGQNAYTGDGYCRWWLRSPGSALSSACYVSEQGGRGGSFVHEVTGAVRPALWVDLGADAF